MKSFFKAAVAVAASAVMVISISSCGRSASSADSDPDAVKAIDSSKATGSLTIWAMGNEGDLLGDFVKGFEKENPEGHRDPMVLSARQTPDRHRRGQRSRPCADGHHLDGRFLQLVLHRARQP